MALSLVLSACGGAQSSPVSGSGSGAAPNGAGASDARSAIEKRRDAACETLGPRITACAVADAKAALAAGKIAQAQFNEITASGVVAKNTEEFIAACKAPATPYSSRQIRVLEVCPKAETECEPLIACLDNLNKP